MQFQLRGAFFARKSMATITADHFGSNIILTRDSVAEGAPFREVLNEISFSHFRYPGGGITEDQTWANGGLDRMFGEPMDREDENYVMTIREALQFARDAGTELSIVIPTFQFYDRATNGFFQEDFDRYLSELKTALLEFPDVRIRDFEIGNEFWVPEERGGLTPQSYGMIANNEIPALHRMSLEIAAANPEWERPGIGIQAGTAWRGTHMEESHQIASEIDIENRALIDTIYQHSYPNLDKEHTGWQQDWAINPMKVYSGLEGFRDDLKFSLSEFNVGGTQTTGVAQAAGWIEEFSSHIDKGIDEFQHWGISYQWLKNKFYDLKFPPGESDQGNIIVKATPLGQIYDLASSHLVGKSTMTDAAATERLGLDGQFGVTAFRDAGQRVLFLHNQSGEGGSIDLTDLPEGWHVAVHHLKNADSPYSGWYDESIPVPPAEGEIADARGDMKVLSGEAAPDRFDLAPNEMVILIITEPGRNLTLEGAHNVTDDRTGMVDDEIHGGEGNDILRGHVGDDTLVGGGGRNVLSGGRGNDLLRAGSRGDVIFADGGHDRVIGGDGNDVILATGRRDGDLADISAGRGQDTVYVLSNQQVVIRDFSDGDALGLGGVFGSADALREASRAEGGDLLVDLPDGGLLRLTGAAGRLDTLHESVIDLQDDGDTGPLRLPEFFQGLSYEQVSEIYGVVNGSGDGGMSARLGWGTLDDAIERLDLQPQVNEPFDPNAPDLWSRNPLPPEEPDEDDDNEEGEQNPGNASGGACFVATAAFGDRMHPDVVALRRFRDRHLVRSRAGRIFVRFYWKIGPGLARVTSPQSPHGRLSRSALSWLVRILSRHGLT